MRSVSNMVILTGAGVSADSGVPTFRTGKDGTMGWDTGMSVHPIEEVATPEAFGRDPARVHDFYNGRRASLASVEPNPAHHALAELEQHWEGSFLLVTQNVDDLHERAGSTKLVHMHGELRKGWCLACDRRFAWQGDMDEDSQCHACSAKAKVRPDIVWFGEMPYQMARIERTLADCDVFVAIGTSGAVYPAACFVEIARYVGAHCVELNLQPSLASSFFDETRIGRASETVPLWVAEMLAG